VLPSAMNLWWGLFFGSIGVGYWMYGKKQKKPVPYWTGIALMVFPYFIDNAVLLPLIGAGLTALPYFYRI